jgi:hypothetical protein
LNSRPRTSRLLGRGSTTLATPPSLVIFPIKSWVYA